MTSFIIKSQVDRSPSLWSKNADDDCPFCRIITRTDPAHLLFEDDKIIAILDIQPLRKGHTLVIPKIHCRLVSDLPPDYAAAIGAGISRVAAALVKTFENEGLNIVANQVYAQAVSHVHYHIIPAPRFDSSPTSPNPAQVESTEVAQAEARSRTPTNAELHKVEFENRHDVDDDNPVVLVEHIRARI